MGQEKISKASLLAIVSLAVAAWSLVDPFDYWVWVFEIFAGVIGVGLLFFTRRRFVFSNLFYFWAGVHFIVLAVAAKYTYAEMPLFNWLRDTFEMSRNHYDRVGHFFQGFVPALLAREILIRVCKYPRGKMLAYVCGSVALAFSAFWELLEWWMVIFFYPQEGAEWLGTQGDNWDAQGDMFMALLGAVAALAIFSRMHDCSMASIPTQQKFQQ